MVTAGSDVVPDIERWGFTARPVLNGNRVVCPVPGLMRLSFHGRMRAMAAPRKYPEVFRERAIRMAVDLGRDPQTRT